MRSQLWILVTSAFYVFTSSVSGDSGSSSPYRLNVPRLLLPYTPKAAHHVTYTLEAHSGCYAWTSAHPDVASVTPIADDGSSKQGSCSSKAIVRSESLSAGFRTTTIIAREIELGLELRCVVDVASISKISISTVRREVYVDEAPVKMGVRAWDEKGNVFSRLTGFIFEWTLSKADKSEGASDPQAIASFETFDESQYEGEDLIVELERKGLRGDEVLLEGLSVGIVRVNARLVNSAWKRVSAAESDLLVVENLQLLPSLAYIMPGAHVHYSVVKVTATGEFDIKMPCEQYELTLLNKTVGKLDLSQSLVTGLQLGSSKLQLSIQNMPSLSERYHKAADLHVVLPAYLQINIHTGSWVLEVGRLYIITVTLFDSGDNQLLITDNMRLSTQLSSYFDDILFASANGSYFHARAVRAGVTTIKSNLTGVENKLTGEFVPLATPVHRSQPVDIFNRIDLQPDVLAFPWHPEQPFQYNYPMKVVGGSGQFRWGCQETAVARIDGHGVLTSIGAGIARPKVTDAKNSLHFDVSTAYVVRPVDMKFVPSPVEAQVGNVLDLPLSVFGKTIGDGDLIPFVRCHRLPLQWSFTEDGVFAIDETYETDFSTLPSKACVALRIRALRVGFTELRATYDVEGISLSAKVVVAGYNPLKLVSPEDDALVALGSSWNYAFQGGPLPWILEPSKFFQDGQGSKTEGVAVFSAGKDDTDNHLLRIVCRELGQHTFSVRVGNTISQTNLYPANASTSARVTCGTPSSLELSPDLPDEYTRSCPWFREKATHLPVLYDTRLGLLGHAYDQLGHRFSNFSSLKLSWDTDSSSVAMYVGSADHSAGYVVSHSSAFVESEHTHGMHAQLTLASAQYSSQVLQAERVSAQAPFPRALQSTLKLRLSGRPYLDPASITVFNHPDNKMPINIEKGSGFFSVRDDLVGDVLPARLTYTSKAAASHQVDVLPQAGGQMSAIVNDQCLVLEPMRTKIRILDGSNIELTVADMVMTGKHLVAAVRVLDTNDEPFELEQYQHMNLRPLLIGPFISAAPAGTSAAPKTVLPLPSGMQPNSLLYVIEGVQEGDAQLLFNATLRSNRVITSEAAKIQVYSPLRIEPRVVRLVPTAHYQVRVTGGPRPQLGVTFHMDNSGIASCDASGVITAHTVGETTLTGHAQSSMDGSAILTEDTVRVIVVQLTGVKIYAPSTRVLSTTETSVYAKGLSGETPVVFGTADPPIQFYWEGSDDNIFQLQSVYRRAGAVLDTDLQFPARLLARSAGDATIRLRAECGNSGACNPRGAVFRDQLRINVVEKLHIVRPTTVANGSLLMPLRSTSQIVTNRAGHCLVTYQLLSAYGKDCASSIIKVNSDGVLTSSGVTGTSHLLITAHEHSSFNQTLVLQVEVKPIASVSIHSYTAARAVVGRRHALPLGLHSRFSVTLQDDLGQLMDTSSTQFVYRMTRSDVARLQTGPENGTFYLRAAKEGSDVLQVSAIGGQSIVEDFINVHVGIGILPADPVLHIGTKVCFTTHLTGDNDESGYWSTSNPSVLSIEAATGLAHALAVGHSTITFLAGGTELAMVEVSVSQVAEVSLDLAGSPTLTNAANTPMSQISIPVVFSTGAEHNNGRFSIFPGPTAADQCSQKLVSRSGAVHSATQQVPFSCVLSSGDRYLEQSWLSGAFHVEGKFDSKTGDSYCLVKAQGAAHPSTWSQPLQLNVQVSDAFSTYSVQSRQVDISFIPAFTINTAQFDIKDSQPPSHVVLQGPQAQLAAIKASSSEPSLVTIQAAESSDPADGSLTYRLSIAATAAQFQSTRIVNVDFVSSLTGQREVVVVTYTPPSENPTATFTANLQTEVAPSACAPVESQATTATPATASSPASQQKSPQPGVVSWMAEERNTPYILGLALVFTILAVLMATLCLIPGHARSPPSSSAPGSPQQSNPYSTGFSPSRGMYSQHQHSFSTPPPASTVTASHGHAGAVRHSPEYSPFTQYSPPPAATKTSPFAQGLLSEDLQH
eukprot:scpid5767/ scgid13392/ Nuclear pore membrane glycoprotein 210; Nuclear envelope pore membrane protein POM 210; Nucleoporin Nup210; Pore membrane protein of 210 kDa